MGMWEHLQKSTPSNARWQCALASALSHRRDNLCCAAKHIKEPLRGRCEGRQGANRLCH